MLVPVERVVLVGLVAPFLQCLNFLLAASLALARLLLLAKRAEAVRVGILGAVAEAGEVFVFVVVGGVAHDAILAYRGGVVKSLFPRFTYKGKAHQVDSTTMFSKCQPPPPFGGWGFCRAVRPGSGLLRLLRFVRFVRSCRTANLAR